MADYGFERFLLMIANIEGNGRGTRSPLRFFLFERANRDVRELPVWVLDDSSPFTVGLPATWTKRLRPTIRLRSA